MTRGTRKVKDEIVCFELRPRIKNEKRDVQQNWFKISTDSYIQSLEDEYKFADLKGFQASYHH